MQKGQAKRYLRISSVGSRSGGLDRTGTRSNRVRPRWIVRLRQRERGGGGGTRRNRRSAAARGWKLAGVGRSDAPGLGLGQGLAEELVRGMASPPRHS